MSQLTKKAIIEYTMALAVTKPVTKITVRDIVDACGITRNTFYYYFHDIYDVLSAFFQDKVADISSVSGLSLEEQLFELMEFCATHRKLFMNIYKSLGYEQLSAYIMQALHGLMVSYIQSTPGGANVSERDTNIICGFYEEAIFGVLVRWMKTTRHGDDLESIQALFRRIRYLFDGQLDQIIRRSLDKEPEEEQS